MVASVSWSSVHVLRATDTTVGTAADVIDTLSQYSPALLRHIVRCAEKLIEYREFEARLAEKDDENEMEERSNDIPGDVPLKARITIKAVEKKDKIRPKYKAAVNPNDKK